MTDWLAFEGRVEPLPWGKATYTILRLPPDVATRLQAAGARRVEGEINDHPVNLALTRAPVVDGVFLWAGAQLLSRLGIAPGESLDIRLRPAADDRVDAPEDLALALRQAGLSQAWADLTPGKRRGLLYHLDTAKTASTRAKRILTLLQSLT
ncbi:MAG: hypothetical protein RIT14_390 [Pseudomonadota bacterium]